MRQSAFKKPKDSVLDRGNDVEPFGKGVTMTLVKGDYGHWHRSLVLVTVKGNYGAIGHQHW